MEETLITIAGIKPLIKRRFLFFLLPFVLITAAGVGLALLLPPIYQSTGIIMIESQQVPLDLVRTTVTGYAEERIQRITQQIMGRTTLLELINRYGLFKETGAELTEEARLEKLREAFNTEMIGAEVPDERTGRAKTVNVAFSVSADWENRQTAMQMANFVISKYLEYNIRERQERVLLTSDIIKRQLSELEELLVEQEKKIADYKAAHPHALPELYQVNLQTEAHLRRGLADLDNQVNSLKDRKVYLEGQLATVEQHLSWPTYANRQVVLGDEEYLWQLERREVDLAAKYSAKYPDLKKIREEIAIYRHKIAKSRELAAWREELQAIEADYEKRLANGTTSRLGALHRHKTSADIRAAIQKLEEENPGIVLRSAAQNPAFINLQTQIRATTLEIEGLLKQRQEHYDEWQQYLKRLEETPLIEKAFQEMTRGYASLKNRYEETMTKHLEAKNAETVEESQAGEKFTVLEPPLLPEEPYKPNRLVIILIGTVLGLGGGVGLAALSELADTRIHTARDISTVADLPILGLISDTRKISAAKYGKLYARYARQPETQAGLKGA